ncbi:MAG: ATP-binding cassette domain-containing protein, partial [Pseudomonadota bacterium]
VDDTGGKLLEDASFTIEPGTHVATVGEVNSGAEALAEALARLHPPARGRVLINGEPIEALPEAITGRRIAYLSSEPILHNTSLKENLLYGLKHGSPKPGASDEAPLTAFEIAEASASGNPLPDAARNWIDFSTAGVADHAELRLRLGDVLKLVGLESDVVDLGLRSTIDTELHDDWSKRILEARAAMKVAVEAPENAGLIEVFDPKTYNQQMTIGGNILFGRARKAAFEADQLAENPFVRELLATSGLDERLFLLGREIADTMIELFADLEPGNSFLEQMAFMSPDELPTYRSRLSKEGAQTYATARPADQAAFLRLALAYIEPQHRLGLIDNTLRDDILEARKQVFETLPAEDDSAVAFYDPETFNPGSSLQDNILFGRAAYGISKGPETLRRIFRGILDDLDMNDLVFEAGLEFSVGSGGRRLTSSQRQRVGIARALLKRPDLLIVNRGLSALSARSQTRVMTRVLKSGTGRADEDRASFATFWVLMNPQNATMFDEVLVFESGRLVEQGEPETLAARKGHFARLLS